ncbi:hypothetical protein CAEBREN_19435 [Caenorhabditis brenneri]|uniref:Uncharacterized protein n=1 Tax=Caenorhabditis brenneri TaxID=135651 RepID=G0NXG5_CAEBE|nr:hypothetical protein CAEBREN_19435 [Caenorhabditis brenneri]
MTETGIKVLKETKVEEIVKVEFEKIGRPKIGDLRTDLVVSKVGLPKRDELDEVAELEPLDSSPDPHKIIDGSLSIVTGALTIGFAFFPGIGIAAMMGLGGLIAVGLKAAISKKDETGEQLKKLVAQLKELDRKVSNRFDEMEKFFVENAFGVEVVTVVTTLKRFMMDAAIASYYEATLESENEKDILLAKELKEKAINNFRKSYRKKSPLHIGYVLWSVLAKEATNPLLLTLNKKEPDFDKDDSENDKKAKERESEVARHEYYEKWKETIRNLISELILIEAIATGMFKKQNKHDYLMLIDLHNDIELLMDKFEEKYEIAEYKKKNDNEKYSVLVYRCRQPMKIMKEEYDELSESMTTLMKQKSLFQNDMRSTLNRNILKQKKTVNGKQKNLIRQDGLVLAVKKSLEPEVTAVNGSHVKMEHGPGKFELFHLDTEDVLLLVTMP